MSRFHLFQAFKNKISRRFRKSLKEELFFGVTAILAIFLFGVLIFPTLKSLSLRDFSFLTATIKTKLSSQDLFVEPAKNFLRESPKMSFIENNSLIGVSPPVTVTPQVLGSMLGSVESETEERGVIEYAVESGDTLSSIATKYNISLDTILWANDLNSKSKIKIGQKLIIPPVSGVIHHVKDGDTLSEIAEVYKGKVSEIVDFNELLNENDIYIGDILIVPDGKMPSSQKKSYYATPQVPLGSSYFICPHPACHITQWLHWYNAIDFGGKCGDYIYAAAAGTVQRVKYGWNGGAGNYLKILHPNGVVTMYGHIQASLVSSGESVSQDQPIALMGGKPGTPGAGISTGCHVHFSVSGGRNPFAK